MLDVAIFKWLSYFEKLIYFKFTQPENIMFILVTSLVLKLDKFNDSNWIQLKNIDFIFLTFSVLKLDKLTDFKEVHP